MARSKKAQAAIDDALSIGQPAEQVGLGVDLIEVGRMRRILERTPNFANRVFTDAEIEYCSSKADPAMHYAARFAAKEAVSKSLGTGFSEGIGYRDIEVVNASNGRPSVNVGGKAAVIADELGVMHFAVSLSHTGNDAVACVIAITEGSTAAKRVDPAAELAQRFKETRSMLDEIDSALASKREGASDAG